MPETNSKGLPALSYLERLGRRLDAIEKQGMRQDRMQDEMDRDIAKLEEELEGKTAETGLICVSYLDTRSRCFSVFKRLVLGCSDANDQRLMLQGPTPCKSDPLRDALMYKDQVRTDDWVYREVYGLAWQSVLQYRHHPEMLRALTAYGGIRLRGHVMMIPESIKEAFKGFVTALNRGGHRMDYLDDPQSAEAVAYEKFMAEYRPVFGNF